MKNLVTCILFAAVSLLSFGALAHIPPYWMIMSRTAENHGKGTYAVTQDVIFNHGEEPLIVNERWFITDENNMRLEARGRRSLQNRFALTVVYKNGQAHYVDENGVRRSTKLTNDFFEHYFHFRHSKNIKPTLVQLNIAPSVSLKSGTYRFDPKNPARESEPYVRLARVGGVIAYGIGTPTPTSSAEMYPGIWIEQDQFVIRRLRLPSELQVDASEFKNHSGGLWFPKERTVTWSNHSVKITVSNVSPARATSALKASMAPTSLNFGKDPTLARKLPEDEAIRAFYSRMR